MSLRVGAGVVAACLVGGPIHAQDEDALGWSGETSLSASTKTGNTEATDFGAGAKLEHRSQLWTHAGEVVFDYGETTVQDTGETETTKNRFFGQYQGQRVLSDRWFAYGRGSYELDDFDGFDYRAFLGAGLGWEVLAREDLTWSLQGGPGVRIDALESDSADADAGDTLTEIAVGLGSRYANQFNDNVALTNDTDLLWSERGATLFNSVALTAQLMDTLAARFSFDVAYDTEPVAGFEETDTTTRASLIYTFGD